MPHHSESPGSTLICNRRHFLVAAGLAVACQAEAAPDGERILDFHQHTRYGGDPSHRRSEQQLVAHQVLHGVTTSVLLAGAGWLLSEVGDNASCAALEADYPAQFVRFACADPAESRAIDVLRGNISRGAIGLGEMKFPVAVDSPEMHRIYKLAEEHGLPVLIHFQHETYNTGIERFESVLKAYPKVHFIGHAQTWWGNISTNLNPMDLYPKGPVRRGGLTERLLQDFPNMHGDLSAESGLNALTRDPEFAAGFIERHGRKLIWASDCNCLDGKGAGTSRGYCIAARSLAALRKLAPNGDVFRRIVYENGAGLLAGSVK
jgi:predicted TIM-barrel fold metal-dependent hydrolase